MTCDIRFSVAELSQIFTLRFRGGAILEPYLVDSR